MSVPTLFDYAGSIHAADPETSRAAARDGKRLGGQRLACLVALTRAPLGLTPHEAWEQTPCAFPHVCATRFADLRKQGLATKTDEVRPTPSGGTAHVWTATDDGRALAQQLTGETQ